MGGGIGGEAVNGGGGGGGRYWGATVLRLCDLQAVITATHGYVLGRPHHETLVWRKPHFCKGREVHLL